MRFICLADFPSDKELQDRRKAEIDCSANLLSATVSCEFNLPRWGLPDRDGARAMGGVKAETVQPRSLFVRPQRRNVSVKLTCTGGRLAKKASEMALPNI